MDVGRNSVLHYLVAGKLARHILPTATGSLNATIFLQRVIMPQDLLVCNSQFSIFSDSKLIHPSQFSELYYSKRGRQEDRLDTYHRLKIVLAE